MNGTDRHRKLDEEFLAALKPRGKLNYVLRYWRQKRRELALEVRNNKLEFYFLGHAVNIKKDKGYKYSVIGSRTFDPTLEIEDPRLKDLVKDYDKKKKYWQVLLDDSFHEGYFKDLMEAVLSRIVIHKRGSISEGVSEMNHLFDNQVVGRNGIMVIDRQFVIPGTRSRIDLLGLRSVPELGGGSAFAIVELKNKNNAKIDSVFTQLKKYIDLFYERYEKCVRIYDTLIRQKRDLGILEGAEVSFVEPGRVEKRHIKGLVVLDNYNIVTGDLEGEGSLSRALDDCENTSNDYDISLMLKTNVLDSAFFVGLRQARGTLQEFMSANR
jgi:hypothetical protein